MKNNDRATEASKALHGLKNTGDLSAIIAFKESVSEYLGPDPQQTLGTFTARELDFRRSQREAEEALQQPYYYGGSNSRNSQSCSIS